MLEICPLALCAYGHRVSGRWHGLPWLCSVQREAAAMRYRITSPASAPPHTAGSATSRAQIATSFESISCTKIPVNLIRIILLLKSIGVHPSRRHYIALGSLSPVRLTESADTQNSSATPAESALRFLLDLKYCRINTCRKIAGGGWHSESKLQWSFGGADEQG